MDFDQDFLNKKAKNIRISILKMLNKAGSGHTAGAMGLVDIFAALYFKILKHNPQNPNWQDRDYLILSNGHTVPVWYASLTEAGYFAKKELSSLRKIDSSLQGHPVFKYKKDAKNVPGIENTSGPLAQGVSQAVGLALGLKRDNKSNRVICVMGDGEQQEGQVWEAFMFANKYKLNNLIFVLDRNHIQIDGKTEQVMPLGDIRAKYEAFGLKTFEINGNNFNEIIETFKKVAKNKNSASVIIAHTIPGKGVSFMENNYKWHGKVPNKQELEMGLRELC